MQKQTFENDKQSTNSGENESFIEERKEILEELFERVEAYVQINIQLFKLRTIEMVAESASTVIARILIIIIALLFFLLLNVGVAIWLGSVLGTPYYGYFILSGFYLLVLIFLFMFRKNLFKKSISESILNHFVKD